jgi:hypothetical protein
MDATRPARRLATLAVVLAMCGAVPTPQHATANSETRRYVAPLTSPFFNETPLITTELRPIYIYNELPKSLPRSGGSVHVGSLQLRLAVTERIGFIVTKNGWADFEFERGSPDSEQGFLNVAFGVKYAAVALPEHDIFVTLGLRYEAPAGNLNLRRGTSMQGGGDGFLDGFVTAGGTLGRRVGLQGSLGYDGAIDNEHDSSFLHLSLHGDIETFTGLFGVLELNMVDTADEAERNFSYFEGFDLVNFGSDHSGTVVTAGFGVRWLPLEHVQLGVAYELPLTDRKDIIDQRVTLDMILWR